MIKTTIGLCVLWLTFASSVQAKEAPVIHAHGFGAVRVGMDLIQASKVMKVKLVEMPNSRLDNCAYAAPAKGYPNLSFMVIDGKIVRAELSDFYGSRQMPSDLMSDKGIRLGDSESKVRQAYGRSLLQNQHEYGDVGDYTLTYWTSLKKTAGVLYETFNGKVTSIHGGDSSIDFLEGCA